MARSKIVMNLLKQCLNHNYHTVKSKLNYCFSYRIYVFGGGHVQKRRFNDTLKIELPDISAMSFD